jgi:hypothetical protein
LQFLKTLEKLGQVGKGQVFDFESFIKQKSRCRIFGTSLFNPKKPNLKYSAEAALYF